jgi:hypothetical protein
MSGGRSTNKSRETKVYLNKMTENESLENFRKCKYLRIDNNKSKFHSKKLTAYHIEQYLLPFSSQSYLLVSYKKFLKS